MKCRAAEAVSTGRPSLAISENVPGAMRKPNGNITEIDRTSHTASFRIATAEFSRRAGNSVDRPAISQSTHVFDFGCARLEGWLGETR